MCALRLLAVLGVDLLREALVLGLGRLVGRFGLRRRLQRQLLKLRLPLLQYADLCLGFGNLAVHLGDLLQQLVLDGLECLVLLLHHHGQRRRDRLHLRVVNARLLLKNKLFGSKFDR